MPAVLVKDIDTLASYEPSETRKQDQQHFRNPKEDVYCFLFDSSCMSGKGRSVLDIFTSAKHLEIEPSTIRSKANGQLYGLLLFYDKAKVSEEQLKSQQFLCSDESLRQVVSWHFTYVDGKWIANTLFDYGTESLCSEDAD